MKIILSRKGVDSSSGGFASPLFTDGSMCSVPIPDPRSPICYGDINADPDFGKLVSNLSSGSITRKTRVHLDPDLEPRSLPREKQWRPLFGQCGAAQSHLDKHAIEEGDLFVFFGWFKQVEFVRRKWRYVSGAPDLHVIFGWLQVDRIVRVADLRTADVPSPGTSSTKSRRREQTQWLQYHPHCQGEFSGVNTIYQAAKTLTLSDRKIAGTTGAGVFRHFASHRQLTAPGRSRSVWTVPRWMHPQGRGSSLSYHTDVSRWSRNSRSTELRSVARGQEFVLDLEHYPEGYDWLQSLWSDQEFL